ncbi:uncharacterized protein LOC116346591 [Contarinia nasturtii]|uniref:uncharacterized protein LOC116346591 n=1 Tax=Contarinia nasturtii TaxID=265458 RepID=UPI0012D3966E|nr:uncharacterized protein LOC116346591 [Contarinia nasturtii]
MPRFFKRSAKVPITNCQQNNNDKNESCADTYRIRSSNQPLDITNQNRLIKNESNADQLEDLTSSVSDRVSLFVNGIFGKMGKNRRKNKLNQQPIQQQQQYHQQSHLKRVHMKSDKQSHGKSQNKTTTENNHVSINAKIKSEINLYGSDGGIYDDDHIENKLQRKLQDSNINISPKILHSDTFNINENERVICNNNINSKSNRMKSASDCINTNNASDCEVTKIRNETIDAVANESEKIIGSSNERIIKNSPIAEKALPQYSYIPIDSSISGKNKNFSQIACKQLLTPQSNNHISSSVDANEANIAVENVGGVQKNSYITVNCSIASNQKRIQPVENLNFLSPYSRDYVQRTEEIKFFNVICQKNQPIPCINKNGTRTTMGQYQSTSTINKSNNNPKQQINPNYTKNRNSETTVTNANSYPKLSHDAATKTATPTAQAPQYDKNKINFSNEINEILESETSSKQSGIEPKLESKLHHSELVVSRTATNEIKDMFYETSSDLNEINSTVFDSDEKSVVWSQYTGTATKNVNDNTIVPYLESISNGTKNNNKTDIKIQKNDINFNVTSNHNNTITSTKETFVVLTSSENDCKSNVRNDDQSQKSSVDTNIQGNSESGCDTTDFYPSNLNKNCEQSEKQMEQNVFYRVDSYNSDDALELSDVEETVIDQNGKVIEVKTLFRQCDGHGKKQQNDLKFKKNCIDNKIDGIRTINGRRRSNSITGSHGSLGIEIVEVGLSSNQIEYVQPFVNFSDESNTIKLCDLRDSFKATENDHAIDIVEIVEESESCSDYEEIDEEIEEEETEEEIQEENELVSAADNSLSSERTSENSFNTPNAFKSNPNGQSIDNIQHSMHSKTNHPNNDNDVICVLVNGQPTRFSANTIKFDQITNMEPFKHSRVNEHEFNKMSHIDKSKKVMSEKISNDKSSSNVYENSSEPIQQKSQHPLKYSDDAMHLPDIVVGSTLIASNGNTNVKNITLSRSLPKIVVNDNTLNSWTSNEEETGTISNSTDESLEIDDEVEEFSGDEKQEKRSNENILHANILNIEKKNESNDSQNKVEGKQHELNLLAQAKSNVAESEQKIVELTYKISELERDLTVKVWNVERLQAELEATYKELNCVKMKLKLQEGDIDALRSSFSEKEDDFNIKYNNLQADHIEMKQKLDQMQSLAISLQVQLSTAQNDLTDIRSEKAKLKIERDVERQALQDALDAAIIERAENDAKWQRDFEHMRTLNSDREELLLQDCEWKIRSTERACKDRINTAEKAKQEAIETSDKLVAVSQTQQDKIKHLKTCEAELSALRGLTNEQRQAITYLTQQLEEMKLKLDETTEQLEEATMKIHKIAVKFASDLSDKDREIITRIDEVRCEVAAMWEDRLLNEMLRLKDELETCFAEDHMEAVQKAQREHMEDIVQLKESFAFREKILSDEIEAIKEKLVDRNRRLDEANDKADKQIMQIRMILNKSEQGHQREIHSQSLQHERQMDQLKVEFEEKEAEMKMNYEEKVEAIKRKSVEDISNYKAEMIAKIKREYETNYEKFKAEKEDEQQDIQRNYKRKLSNAESKIRDMEILHEREIKDLQNAHSMERSSLEKRDLQNSQEIETLHRKCRCLTKLFEEMRIRYERREPRAEDVRTIEELKGIIEAQDKDLRLLTEKLRATQMHQNGIMYKQMNFEQPEIMMEDMQPPQSPSNSRKMKKSILKCDVIYEESENEEEESQTISA